MTSDRKLNRFHVLRWALGLPSIVVLLRASRIRPRLIASDHVKIRKVSGSKRGHDWAKKIWNQVAFAAYVLLPCRRTTKSSSVKNSQAVEWTRESPEISR
jgi:hypothetical protein